MLLVPALAGRADVRIQLPLACPDESEPEPDVAIVPAGSVFQGDHPSWAHLVIEVAASSQDKDRGPKGELYARAGVPEYWIVDVRKRRVECYRLPVDGRYAEASLHVAGETLSPTEFPDVQVELARILPPA
jgi:Uma2 family endonuclease